MTSILTLEESAEYLKLSSDELLFELENNRIPGAAKFAGKWRLKKDVLDRMVEGQPEIKEKIIKQPEIKLEDNIVSSEQDFKDVISHKTQIDKSISKQSIISLDNNIVHSDQNDTDSNGFCGSATG